MRGITDRYIRTLMLSIVAALLLVAHPSAADVITPNDLNPGETYQLMFVTSGGLSGDKEDIQIYNDLVQHYADGADIGEDSSIFGMSINWQVVASTAHVSAPQNAPVYGPVYNMHGQRVATTADQIYAPYYQPENLVTYDEFGREFFTDVWTGGFRDYNPSSSYGQLGAPSTLVIHGINDSFLHWRNAMYYYGYSIPALSFYGLSEVLTMPQPVPEPCTLILVGTGLIGIAGFRRKKKK